MRSKLWDCDRVVYQRQELMQEQDERYQRQELMQEQDERYQRQELMQNRTSDTSARS